MNFVDEESKAKGLWTEMADQLSSWRHAIVSIQSIDSMVEFGGPNHPNPMHYKLGAQVITHTQGHDECQIQTQSPKS